MYNRIKDTEEESNGCRMKHLLTAVTSVLAVVVILTAVREKSMNLRVSKYSLLVSPESTKHDAEQYAKLKKVRFSTLEDEEKLELWNTYKNQFGKSYQSDEEENNRYIIFEKNLKYIDVLNAQNPHALYGLNAFADQSEEERSMRRMKAQNLSEVKSILSQVIGTDVVQAAEQGAFAHHDHRKLRTWLAGLKIKEGEHTDFDQAQGEFAWASASDCAACRKFTAFGNYNFGNMPDNFDWRTLGAVTSVKNQAYCGSCWSFSTAADVEGTWYLATDELISRSPQQLVECNTMNLGCDGGYPFAAMQYLSHIGGMLSWDDLPYDKVFEGDALANPVGTPTCNTHLINEKMKTHQVAHIGGWQMVALGDEYEDLMRVVLLKNGPLSIAFNANGMDYYIHGVAGGCSSAEDCEAGSVSHPDIDGEGDMFTCDPTSLDHAVLAVGYGVQTTDNGDIPYWLIKNSWGDAWGEDGYYRLVRGTNACGVANMVVHSVVKDPSS